MKDQLCLITVLAAISLAVPCHADGLVETGQDDARITHVGPDGDASIDATAPAIVYNPTNNEFMVVYRADVRCGGCYDLYGVILDSDLTVKVADFPVFEAVTGGRGVVPDHLSGNSPNLGRPADVVWDPVSNKYVVTWAADEDPNAPAALADDEFEIFAAKFAPDGTPVGGTVRVSAAGSDGDAASDAIAPRISTDNGNSRWLVVWQQDDVEAVDDRFEVWGQVLEESAGVSRQGNRIKLAEMDAGTEPEPELYSATSPAVVFNGSDFLVAWAGRDIALAPVSRPMLRTVDVDGNLGAVTVIDDLTVEGLSSSSVFSTNLVWNPVTQSGLVAWRAELFNSAHSQSSAVAVNASGNPITGRVHPLNGATGYRDFSEWPAALVSLAASGGFGAASAMLFENTDPVLGFEATLGVAGKEGFSQPMQQRVSDTGPTGSLAHKALNAALALNSASGEMVVVWQADKVKQGEEEIHGQRIQLRLSDVSLSALDVSETSVSAGTDITVTSELLNVGPLDVNEATVRTRKPNAVSMNMTYSLSSENFATQHACDFLDCPIGPLAVGESARLAWVIDTSGVIGLGDREGDFVVEAGSEFIDTNDGDNFHSAALTFLDDGSGGENPGENPGEAPAGSGSGGGALGWLLALMGVLGLRRVVRHRHRW